MSLTGSDLVKIREIIEDVLERKLDDALTPIRGELEALRNDVKEIYDTLADLNRRIGAQSILDPAFTKLSDEEQLLRLNDVLLATAKRLNVKLPR